MLLFVVLATCFFACTKPKQNLISSVRANNIEAVKSLLKKGADPNIQNSQALFDAVTERYTKIVKLLLKHGANPKAQHYRAFMKAASNGSIELSSSQMA